MTYGLSPTYPVSNQNLSAVLVDDSNITGWLHPGFAIHLNRYGFVANDYDFHVSTLHLHTLTHFQIPKEQNEQLPEQFCDFEV